MVSASSEVSSAVPQLVKAWCVFRLLPFVIGDLVPVRHDSWKLYLLLSEIMDKVIALQLEISAINYQELLISDFYASFAKKAPHLVKPKLQFFLHYPSMIKNFGLLDSSMNKHVLNVKNCKSTYLILLCFMWDFVLCG